MFRDLFKKLLHTKVSNKKFNEISNKREIEIKENPISANLEKTIEIFEQIYSIPENKDVKIRRLVIKSLNRKAAILTVSTITDPVILDDFIIKPLLRNANEKKVDDILQGLTISPDTVIMDIITKINNGHAVLFIEGFKNAFCINAANFHGRDIGSPDNEIALKGSKEAFTEKMDINISLIRKRIRNESLIFESTMVSERARNEVTLVYLKDITNEKLLNNIRERLKSLSVDSIQNLGLLEQHIEERTFSIFPTILYTERPDRATAYIENGYIILIMENSPASLIVPATFWSFFHTSEDYYMRFLYGNFTRALRAVGMFITIFASAIYVSITNYHTEMIPPDLLLAIASTREKVPFPALFEVFLMEIAFELIREGGLRVPAPIGPTIGIVGALILGQAAVQANIVSPIVVIVVALSGLSSFTVGDLSMNFTIRLIRFCFLIAGGLFGFYGMTALFTAGIFYLVSLKSFGVPYLAPMTPKYISSKDTVFRRMLKDEMFRPGYLKPKDMKKTRRI
ncbi:spore germination protein [Bacillus sp. S/N-304-OC-R1]|uniref:spore germination protein n=1 Tax=Bacillus sp. S/N-304-OC-R1 TaxID=2758034 RepID=UPI001C8D09E4|nr:spore germination protein [Bacillus sp. S/N-304-OC-R1]MBY0121707.1 spore germination protein [Bacillus sp. S/N-304-OC-R1]